MRKLITSKNPEKESKQYAWLALFSAVVSLFAWVIGLLAIAAGIRAAVLSKQVNNKKYLTISIIAIALGAISVGYYLIAANS